MKPTNQASADGTAVNESDKPQITRTIESAKYAFEDSKRAWKTKVSGLEDMTWDDLDDRVQEHIKTHPSLSPSQIAVLVVMSKTTLVTEPSLFLEAFKEPEPLKGFNAPLFKKAFGDPDVFDRMHRAAKGELTSTVMKGTRLVTAVTIAYVVETLQVHDETEYWNDK